MLATPIQKYFFDKLFVVYILWENIHLFLSFLFDKIYIFVVYLNPDKFS